MALGVWQSTIVSESTGLPVPGASVTVTIADTSTLAVLFSDRDGLNPISNPFPSNTHGFVRLYCTPGRYDIVATYGIDQSESWLDTIILEDSSGGSSNVKSITATGDATGVSSGLPDTTLPLTLATVNANPGTHGFAGQTPIITVNEKGLTTAASQVPTETAWGNLTGTLEDQADLNDLLIDIGQSFGATGVTSYGDTVNLVALTDTTLRILPLQQGLFYNEIATSGLKAAFKSFPQTDVALATVPLVADGLYIRYVSYDKLGAVSFSANSTANDYNYIMLGVVFLKRVAGVNTFTNGSVGPRNVLTYPDVSGNNQFVKTFLKFNSNVGILPNANLTIRNLSGFIKGESIAWHTATPNEKPVAAGNPTSFITLNPGTAALVAFPAAGTAVQTTQYWNGAAMVSTGGANTASVQRLIITSTGGFVLQVGEATYASLAVAADSMATAPFTDIFPGLDLFVEIARFAVRNGAANLNLTTDAIFKQAGGIGGTGGAGSGTVTSVGITGNDGIVVANTPVTSSGTISLDLGNITPDSLATNLITLLNASARIKGDFTSDYTTRVYVETSAVNSATSFSIKPSGTAQISDFIATSSSNVSNTARIRLFSAAGTTGIASDFIGSAAYLPFVLETGGLPSITVGTNGSVVLNRGIPIVDGGTFQIGATAGNNIKIRFDNFVSINGGSYLKYLTSADLLDSVTSTSVVTAATSNSVKQAYDLANSKLSSQPLFIEVGRVDGTAAASYIDFHSSAAVADFNARIITSGGSVANGSGTLDFIAASSAFNSSSFDATVVNSKLGLTVSGSWGGGFGSIDGVLTGGFFEQGAELKIFAGRTTSESAITAQAAVFSRTNLLLNGGLELANINSRIKGDMSNATISNRVLFQTTSLDSFTAVGALPNGVNGTSVFQCFGNSNPTNASFLEFGIASGSSQTYISATKNGTGVYYPLNLQTNGSNSLSIAVNGSVSLPKGSLTITGTTFDAGVVASATAVNISGSYGGGITLTDSGLGSGIIADNFGTELRIFTGRTGAESATTARAATFTRSQLSLAGSLSCTTWTATSDRTLKENIKELPLEKCKEILAKVNWHSFDFIDGEKNLNGVIAQELIDIYPDAVVKNADEKYSVNYNLLYNLQMRVNQDLEQRLARLEAILLEK